MRRASREAAGGAARRCAGAALLWVCAGCGPAHTTERVFDGHLVRGPYIEPEAYAAFAEGAYHEQHAQPDAALAAYRRARSLDPDSPGIAARLGALVCRSDLEAGLEALETDGSARDYAPAWAARASCLRQHGNGEQALPAAQRALMLAPRDPEANLLIAQLYRERSQPERARAWLFGWVLSDPGAGAYWPAIAEQGRLAGDGSLGELARQSLERQRADDLEPPAPQLAPRDPLLAFDANPADADAFVAASRAALLAADPALLQRLLRQARVDAAPRAELAAAMVELLRIVVGDDAAQRWSAAYQRLGTKP